MSFFSENLQNFFKMQGSGNDFILIDNRIAQVPQEAMPTWAKALCPRALSIGADGLIFLEPNPDASTETRWHFYNADGSRAEMCGNGSRCAALLAVLLNMAPHTHRMLTDAGPIKAHVSNALDTVEVQLPPVTHLILNQNLQEKDTPTTVHSVNTGVPHAIVLTKELSAIPVQKRGAQFRRHEHFAPHGTNVNFTQIIDSRHLHIRTYERGVENETYACGTGAAAAAVICHALGETETQVQVATSGGESLGIRIEEKTVFLKGAVKCIYQGKFARQDYAL